MSQEKCHGVRCDGAFSLGSEVHAQCTYSTRNVSQGEGQLRPSHYPPPPTCGYPYSMLREMCGCVLGLLLAILSDNRTVGPMTKS